MSLSVAIITHNEAGNLSKLLPLLRDYVDEICVVDMLSSDDTPQVVAKFGGKLYSQAWLGFAEQKNMALDKCSGDWVLCLDADEFPTPALMQEVQRISKGPMSKAYRLRRKTFYHGKTLQYAWQPDWQLRLFPREHARWRPIEVHETLQTTLPVLDLKGFVVHHSYKNLEEHYQKTIKYARLMGESYFRRGKKGSFFKMLFAPTFAFCKSFFFRGGFLDGVPGLIACASEAHYTALKYFFLWELHRHAKKN